ncbi:PAB-dependent poly(A)-specific ribonuclease subunit 3 [Malassezia cuniculi]|uniref:PAN2-PAN3 deadenylation complex subunit PAN3 n=1 Tax=Malassezia cuniculi TaxID=948313 RepID=A0AAF0F1Z5_9BASI|nr:PAB-dependent poly(A)-specific ribonuclease subunit 3 [Malassezia cuniculi]
MPTDSKRGAADAPSAPAAAPAHTEGTSLSNLLSSTNASLANISFQPRAALSTKVAEAPVFVPREAQEASVQASSVAHASAGAAAGISSVAGVPHVARGSSHALGGVPSQMLPSATFSSAAGYEQYDAPYGPASYEPDRRSRQPLQYHLYAPPQPHVSNLHPSHLATMAFFMDPALSEELQRKHEALYAVTEPSLSEQLPEMLHVYHSLVPLEATAAHGVPQSLQNPRFSGGARALTGACGDPSRTFGYNSHVYKATCVLDGKCYVLRRIAGFHLQHEAAIGLVERWRKIRNPGIVAVREAFTTRAFGDHSIVFVYDYHPHATTLYMEHLTVKPLRPDRRGRLVAAATHIPERVLWSYICQMASVLRVIHRAGLAACTIDASKVLYTGQNRVRINCCGIFDVLTYTADEAPDVVQQRQRDDMRALGSLVEIIARSSNGAAARTDIARQVALRGFSEGLADILHELTEGEHTADSLLVRVAPRLADELGASLNYADLLEASLMRELENARLVRLLCTLNFVNERPEFEQDARWSETGDRYVAKLFRDMVFHAVDEHGRPVLDMSHVLMHLNKLDAGSQERFMLTSRDEQTCLLVTYAEVRRCIEASAAELAHA